MKLDSTTTVRSAIQQDELHVHFPDGLPAFENARDFALVAKHEIEPFMILQSRGDHDFGFFCIDPFLIYPGYVLVLKDADQQALQAHTQDDLMLLSFVTRTQDPRDFSANLLGPVVINLKKGLARQVVAEDYPVRHNIWQALEKLDAGTQTGGDTSC